VILLSPCADASGDAVDNDDTILRPLFIALFPEDDDDDDADDNDDDG